ncbi:Pfs domain protein, putative [Aspergillus lentulus]|uniref:putative Pfs domain protein n=1 Tax=Aspergillus lentulus TaxID=293939 RepID=UPI001393EF3C|nr:Pfs domain protein, putative [Aspergillus lentulus]GFF39405.1 Pfs domain protein, putative [Aspergillus lentulus]GFF75099.1 Pfs domain protein, putative [Aspergillus lentulus]GFG09465.1 Pfs domain protein, putative [Aspergillus lentulus]
MVPSENDMVSAVVKIAFQIYLTCSLINSFSLRTGIANQCPESTNDFTVAIICASRQELMAVKTLFDEDYGIVGDISGIHPSDTNSYIAGRIGKHRVILTQISKYGKVFAAKTSFWLSVSFPQIRICLVVSTGAGIPCTKDGQEIRLGDVLVSEGIIEYDLGKLLPGGVFLRKTGPMYDFPPPAGHIARFLNLLRRRQSINMMRERMSLHLNYLQATICDLAGTNYPEENELFPRLSLRGYSGSDSYAFNSEARNKNALLVAKCPSLDAGPRAGAWSWSNIPAIEYFKPNVHFGWLASGDKIMRSAEMRDQTAAEEGVIGFEWAGVGVWRELPTMVITGVGNYGDGYGADPWPAYASASAASCAKAILEAYRRSELP